MHKYTYQDMLMSLYGAAFLGSGGGGDFELALEILQHYVPEKAALPVYETTDPEAGGTNLTTFIGTIGTPNSNITSHNLVSSAFAAYKKIRGAATNGQVNFVAPTSVNATNMAILWAAAWEMYQTKQCLGLVNCDGAGRGTSSLATLNLAKVTPTPLFATSDNPMAAEQVELQVPNALAADSIIRGLAASAPYAGYATTGAWAMSSTEVRAYSIANTITLARQAGYTMHAGHPNTLAVLLDTMTYAEHRPSKILFSGSLTIAHEFNDAGTEFQQLSRKILQITNSKGQAAYIYTMKESMIYWDPAVGNRPEVVAPATIGIWANNDHPITDSDIHQFVGQWVQVYGISPADEILRSVEAEQGYEASLKTLNYAGPTGGPIRVPGPSPSKATRVTPSSDDV